MSDTDARREKRPITLNYETNAVEINGMAFPCAQMPEKARQHFMLKGYGAYLLTKKDMPAAHADAIKGDVRALNGKAEAKPDALIEAAANVHAEEAVRAMGVRAVPGKGIRSTQEFADARASALSAAATWSKAQRAEAKKHPLVMAEHAKLTGATASVTSLFASPVVSEQAA